MFNHLILGKSKQTKQREENNELATRFLSFQDSTKDDSDSDFVQKRHASISTGIRFLHCLKHIFAVHNKHFTPCFEESYIPCSCDNVIVSLYLCYNWLLQHKLDLNPHVTLRIFEQI